MTFEEAQNEFAAAKTVAAQREAARELLRGTTLHKALKDERFVRGLDALRQSIRDEQAGKGRLEALALYVRVGSGLRYKATHAYFVSVLSAIHRPLGVLGVLDDPDDRYYVTWALRWIGEPWASTELARLAVEEEADNVRGEALRGLVERATTLHEALEQLLEAAGHWRPETEFPATSYARRMKRVFVQLRDALDRARAAQPICGPLLAKLARPPQSRAMDVDGNARDHLAESALQLVHLLLRVRFSLAADERTYEMVPALKSWFSPATAWARFVSKSDGAALVARDIEQAIEMLAKQGRGDEKLVTRLRQLVGEEDLRRRLAVVADEGGGIEPELREWLRTGKVSREPGTKDPNAELVAAAQGSADIPTLALMLRDAEGMRQRAAALAREAMPDIEMFAPQSAAVVSDLAARVRVMVQQVENLAARRGLRVRGERSLVVEYVPLEHELVEGDRLGVRWVRIVEPAVEQTTAGRVEVVIKALVVPAAAPNT